MTNSQLSVSDTSSHFDLLKKLAQYLTPILCFIMLVQLTYTYNLLHFPNAVRTVSVLVFFCFIMMALFLQRSWTLLLCAGAICFFQLRYAADPWSHMTHHHFYFFAIFLVALANIKLIDERIRPESQQEALAKFTVFSVKCLISGIYFHSALAKLSPLWLTQDQLLQIFMNFHSGSFIELTPFIKNAFHILTWATIVTQLAFAVGVLFVRHRYFIYLLIIFHLIVHYSVPVGSFSVLFCFALVFVMREEDLRSTLRLLRVID